MKNEMPYLGEWSFFGHYFRMYNTWEKPYFVAVDVAKIIDYSAGHTGQMLSVVDHDEKLYARIEMLCAPYNTRGTLKVRRRQDVWMLTEYGLYEVLMQSTKPIARNFKAYVKHLIKDCRINHYPEWFYEDEGWYYNIDETSWEHSKLTPNGDVIFDSWFQSKDEWGVIEDGEPDIGKKDIYIHRAKLIEMEKTTNE